VAISAETISEGGGLDATPQRAKSVRSLAVGPRRPLAIRCLRKAVQTLNGSIHLVAGAWRRSISAACAEALKGDLRDVRDRAGTMLKHL